MYISAQVTRDMKEVMVWERTKRGRELKYYPAPYYFYVKDDEGQYEDVYGNKLRKMNFSTWTEFKEARDRYRNFRETIYESDIPLDQKILSEHYFGKEMKVDSHISFFDIEVDYDIAQGFNPQTDRYAPINAISLFHFWSQKTYMLLISPHLSPWNPGPEWKLEDLPEDLRQNAEIEFFESESELLVRFFELIDDSDVISGWNSEGFDVPYVYERCLRLFGDRGKSLWCFEGAREPVYKEIEGKFGQKNQVLEIFGREHIDYMRAFQKFEAEGRPSYTLESISEEFLPELPKLEYEGSLYNLYRNDFETFVRYGIRDSECLDGFEKKLGYIRLAIQMTQGSTTHLKHVMGTLKVVESAIINYCHYEIDRKVPDSKYDNGGMSEKFTGAAVLKPRVGMHGRVSAVDINSLYPSAMRTVNISPEKIVGQFFENHKAYEHIFSQSGVELTFRSEDGETESRTGKEWYDYIHDKGYTISGYGTIFNQDSQGFIPAILQSWYTLRKKYQAEARAYKAKMDECKVASKEYNEYKIKHEYFYRLQYVYKILLNSLYGSLGNQFFKFFDIRLAESTTRSGREILMHMIAEVSKWMDGEYIKPERTFDSDGKEIFLCTSNSIVYGDSVAGNSKIITPDGEIDIDSLFTSVDDARGEKEYCLTNLGKVLTYDPVSKRHVYRDVKYIMRHAVSKDMFRVWITNSQYIDVTEDHSLMAYNSATYRKRMKTDSIISEVKPEELAGRSLVYMSEIPDRKIESKGWHPLLYTLMGLVLGDGYILPQTNYGIDLSLGKGDFEEIYEKVISPLISAGHLTNMTPKNKKNHDFNVSGSNTKKILYENLYDSSGKKHVPEWMQYETDENIGHFLSGLFSADGTVMHRGNSSIISLCSVNENHIVDVQKLLFKLGIASTWFTENTENHYNRKYSGTFSKKLTVKNQKKFIEKVGFIQDRKNNKIRIIDSKQKQAYNQYGFELVKAVKIEKIDIPEYVYDIEVEDTHTFFANNILVHNTDSCYFDTYAEDYDEALEIANFVEKKVNKSFEGFVKEAFNSDNNVIAAGLDLISSKCIFVKPKMYIMHLDWFDGNEVDKMKVMGLQIKKTTIPKPIGQQLTTFIEELLKGHEWRDIQERIVAYKDSIISAQDVMDIGLPKGIKGIEEYTERWNRNEPDLRLPGHVAASIFYNHCLEQYGDKESPKIVSGSKIKTYYLTKNFGKFKSIAIPTDTKTLPKWFEEHFVDLIDRDAQALRLIDKPLSSILTAIGERIPTKKTLLFDSLVEY